MTKVKEANKPTTIQDGKVRCNWSNKTELYQRYHDEEWGIAIHDEQKHFEVLLLETMQAGLSWYTILQRREGYRAAFANFIAEEVCTFDQARIEELMQNTAIIRNRGKIEAAVTNARLFIAIQKEFGSFDNYIWGFTNYQVVKNNWTELSQIPAKTELSDKVAAD